ARAEPCIAGPTARAFGHLEGREPMSGPRPKPTRFSNAEAHMSHDNPKEQSIRIKAAPRAIALVGPHGGGKTSLLESIAMVTGAIPRKGSVPSGSSLGDTSPESRARQMSVEMNVLTTQYMDEEFTFLDCPGSIEFLGDTLNVLQGIDLAVVVW